jgi:hypothetical protein
VKVGLAYVKDESCKVPRYNFGKGFFRNRLRVDDSGGGKGG